MLGRWKIGSGQWKENSDSIVMGEAAAAAAAQQEKQWDVGQIVDVRSRTWVG